MQFPPVHLSPWALYSPKSIFPEILFFNFSSTLLCILLSSQTADGIIILAAMTRGIRDNWVQAINKALVTAQEDKAKANKDTPSSEDNKSVEEVVSSKQASSTESANIDASDSVSESNSAPERTSSDKKESRRASVNRDKSSRERRSRRSSRELRDLKRLSVDSVDLPSIKSSNGDQDSSKMTTSTPVSKDKLKPSFSVGEPELSNRNSGQGDSAVMELLETEVCVCCRTPNFTLL